jgi:glycosyltransferase involved in cell wall biosynthesis
MRILQITRDYLSNGGIGRYVQDVTAALNDARHDVAVVCSEASPDAGAYVVPGCDEFEHRDARCNRQAVLEFAAGYAPDYVLLHAMDDYRLEAMLRERYRVARFIHNHVYCPSGLDYDAASERSCDRAQGLSCISGYMTARCWDIRNPATATKFYRRSAAAIESTRTAPLVFTASQYVRGRLVRNGVPASRITVAPYFAGVPGGVPSGSATRSTNSLLFVGRLVPEKGLAYLLRAMRSMDPATRLTVNGDGPARAELVSLTQGLGLAGRVDFRGWTSRTELLACYERADVVVVPSLWPEPFGLVGIEAMAYGKPVVAFRGGGIPEWLADGGTGYAVECGDVAGLARRCSELLGDPELRLRMGERARARVRNEFSRERHVAAITDALANTVWSASPQRVAGRVSGTPRRDRLEVR